MDADSVTGPYQALRSRRPKGHGLIVSPPAWREAALPRRPKLPASPHRLKLREATSGKPGGYVGQAGLQDGSSKG